MSPSQAIHPTGSKKLPRQRNNHHQSDTAQTSAYSDASQDRLHHQQSQQQQQQQQKQLRDYINTNRTSKPTISPIESWLGEPIREQPWTGLRVHLQRGRDSPKSQSLSWPELEESPELELEDLDLDRDLLPFLTSRTSYTGSESLPGVEASWSLRSSWYTESSSSSSQPETGSKGVERRHRV
ncbi:hypothetical protein B0H65DRAFT_451081 [Neurospora tetraspora]|uniref:Uncharacterized protein n=1 Tax=Neurospora tetraspora TaxID=94610 RepID=A0AAE0JPN7_9PEZI|nr:hypothetical protein B0H65DRAFT_451081 [Neurospora tetraspora]